MEEYVCSSSVVEKDAQSSAIHGPSLVKCLWSDLSRVLLIKSLLGVVCQKWIMMLRTSLPPYFQVRWYWWYFTVIETAPINWRFGQVCSCAIDVSSSSIFRQSSEPLPGTLRDATTHVADSYLITPQTTDNPRRGVPSRRSHKPLPTVSNRRA